MHWLLPFGIYDILLCMCAFLYETNPSPPSPMEICRYLLLLWWWFIVASVVCLVVQYLVYFLVLQSYCLERESWFLYFVLLMSQCLRFPTMWHLTSVDSDEPVQPPLKLRNSK